MAARRPWSTWPARSASMPRRCISPAARKKAPDAGLRRPARCAVLPAGPQRQAPADRDVSERDARSRPLLRGFGEDKIGPELFHLSYDYVGDLAETLSLIWETDPNAGPPPTLGEVVDTLQTATKMQTPAILKRWLDSLDATGR